MKKIIARLNTRIDFLEAEFNENNNRLSNFGHITNKEDRIMRRRFEITIKEVSREQTIKTAYIGDATHQYLVDFFGLNEPDVEWYGIEIIDEEDGQ